MLAELCTPTDTSVCPSGPAHQPLRLPPLSPLLSLVVSFLGSKCSWLSSHPLKGSYCLSNFEVHEVFVLCLPKCGIFNNISVSESLSLFVDERLVISLMPFDVVKACVYIGLFACISMSNQCRHGYRLIGVIFVV